MADFTIKQSDVLPILNDQLSYSDGTNPNLTGHTVNLVVRALTANDVTFNKAATLGSSSTAASVGGVSYTFTAGDTNLPGLYVAYWHDITAGQVFPSVGYLTLEVQENLTTPGGSTIVALGDVKDYLNIAGSQRTHDGELLRFIAGITPVVEMLTGPILQRTYDETYDGGTQFISVRHRPIIEVNHVWEFRGPILYNLQQINNPAEGTIYSYMFEKPGRIVRRTVGGGVTTFPPGFDSVFVNYTAGYQQVPENIRLGALEIIRVNYQQTQQGPRPGFGGGSAPQNEDVPGQQILGFFVPGRARELLAPSRRHPSIA